jgi:uncharacterized protein GlcG (DUF336 family)
MELTEAQIKHVADAAVASAIKHGVRVSMAIVDGGGHLLWFSRMSGVHSGTVEVAQAKARSAMAFRRPTRVFAEALSAGNLALLTTPGVVVLPGGIPFERNGSWLGAIGISGAAPNIDEAIASAAMESLMHTL